MSKRACRRTLRVENYSFKFLFLFCVVRALSRFVSAGSTPRPSPPAAACLSRVRSSLQTARSLSNPRTTTARTSSLISSAGVGWAHAGCSCADPDVVSLAFVPANVRAVVAVPDGVADAAAEHRADADPFDQAIVGADAQADGAAVLRPDVRAVVRADVAAVAAAVRAAVDQAVGRADPHADGRADTCADGGADPRADNAGAGHGHADARAHPPSVPEADSDAHPPPLPEADSEAHPPPLPEADS